MTLRLRTFGSVYLTRDGDILSGAAAQRRLLAILAVLAAAGERGMSRDKLLALFWSEGDPDKSRHALNQSLYHIKKALKAERILLSGADIRVNASELSSDVGDFDAAIRAGQFEAAARLHEGPFMDGFYLSADPGFEFWVTTERDRLGRLYVDALTTLADHANAADDLAAEARWLTRLADHDPLNGPATARLMARLAALGETSAALHRAAAYEARLRTELDLPPDESVVRAIEDIRRSRATTPSAAPAASAAHVDASSGAPAAPSASETTFSSHGTGTDRAPLQSPVAIAPTTASSDRRRRRARVWAPAAVSLGALVVLANVAASRLSRDRAAVRQATIMVAPFGLASNSPGGEDLRDGLLDLITTRIAYVDTKRPADQARVMAAWHAAGVPRDSASAIATASRVGSQLDAGEAVVGSLSTSAAGVSITASLVDVADARVKATARVDGSPDSLPALADRIVSSLLLGEAGDHAMLAASQTPTGPLALRGYIAGRGAYKRGDYYTAMRAYSQALTQDPSFAPAGLGLAVAADRVNAAEQHDRAIAVAWARQTSLSPVDRAFLHAFAGPRYPQPSSASEALAAWERVVRIAPDRAEGWHELGESFYYDAEVLGLRDGAARAEKAFRRALALDPHFAPSRRMLTLLLARQHETDALRRLLASSPPDTDDAMSVFVRWRAAQALNDRAALARVRASFSSAPNIALRSIAEVGQFDGVSIGDGDRALELLRRRQLTEAEAIDVALARHSRALNAGDAAAALAVTRELAARESAMHPELRLRVLDALYSIGDRAAAVASVAALARLNTTSPVTMPDSALHFADLCVLGQWWLSAGDTVAARGAVRELRIGGIPRFPIAVGANPLACAELLDVSLAIEERGPAARDRLAHLDSLMLSGPAVGDAMRYANLVVARYYQKIGDPARGLAALQRRSYMRGWPRYRATGLRLQMELARTIGDTATARSAAERLNATRRPPPVGASGGPLLGRLRRLSHALVH